MSEVHQSLEEILFDLAVQKPNAAERAAFLDHACRDNPTLRAALEELLESHFGAAGFLPKADPGNRPPAAPSVTAPMPPAEAPAQMLGRYKLLEKLGEGGFGEVWMAEQREPVKRRVALKIIKLGMGSRQIVARFEAERQALAMMDHPNIAKIFDADVTETGRPYFVMELVRGIKITEYCDQNQLPTKERLDLFIKVCQAIQHAHQKGIIHRDIKPSNILVTLHDGVPVPKVIDFGIAKATQQELTDKTVFTQFQQFMGTPAYISPEQAEMSGLDIDTRADIYSLGVLLYELLVGQTPFDAKEMMQGGLDALVRIIREREPLRPSTKLNTLPGNARTTAGKYRHTDAGHLVRQLRGDLDWIVMKCLEKDRTRRYDTANGLSMDIRRHLANEPVVARPPSTAYKIQKAWQRNKLAFSAVTAVALALVVGLTVSTWQAVRAMNAEKAETYQRIAAQEAQTTAQSKQHEAEAQRAIARRTAYNASLGSIQADWEKRNYVRVRETLASQRDYPETSFEWFYWQRMAHLELSSFSTYAGQIKKLSLSPDRKKVALVMGDDSIEIRSVPGGEKLVTLPGPAGKQSQSDKNTTENAVFSPDGRFVASCGGTFGRGFIKLWNAETGEEIQSFGTFTGVGDPNVATLPKQSVGFRQYAIAFSPDGRLLASGGAHGIKGVQLWEVATGKKLRQLEAGNDGGWFSHLAFTGDNKRLLCKAGAAVRLYDVETGAKLDSMGDRTDQLGKGGFALSPDSQRLAVHRGNITLYDLSAEGFSKVVWEIPDASRQASLSYSPDGKRLVVSRDGDAIIYDALTGQHQLTLRGGSSESQFLADSQHIISTDGDRRVKVWDAQTNREQVRATTGFRPRAIARDGSRLVVHLPREETGANGGLGVVDTATGRLISTMREHEPKLVEGAVFSPDGKWVASGARDHTIRIWNPLTGAVKKTIEARGQHYSIKFGPKGDIIISGTDRPAQGHAIWNIETGEPILLPQTPVDTHPFAISSDGRRLAEGDQHGQVRIRDTATGQELRKWQAHERQQFEAMMVQNNECMDYSADGLHLVTAGFDGFVKLWDAETGNLERVFAGHSGIVVGVHFTPDQRRLISQGEDGTVRIWDPASGRELLSLTDPLFEGMWIWFVTVSPDGRKLSAAPGHRKELIIWEAATPAQVAAWQRAEEADAALWAAEQPKVEARRLARLTGDAGN